MKPNKEIIRDSAGWIAFYQGKRIATFNSLGAALAGIEVEKHRREKQEREKLGTPNILRNA